MKKTVILVFILCMLAACSSSTDSPPSTTPPTNQVSPTETSKEPSSTTTTSPSPTELNFFGYEPKNELEEEYFNMIAKLAQATSYEVDFTYETYLYGEDDLNEEIYQKDRVVVSPFQLYREYSSFYMRSEQFELYVKDNEAYKNSMFDGWEQEADASFYEVNVLPSRAELMLALIGYADEVYEIENGEITFDIRANATKDAARIVQLAFFHNVANFDDAKTAGVYDLVDAFDGLENMIVTIKTDENEIDEIEIYAYLDRVDEETVNYHYFKEEYDDLNKIRAIEVPAEVYQ